LKPLLHGILMLLGYTVRKNQRLTGVSGARHEVDVVLERNGQIVGVVEAKNYNRPVPRSGL